MGYVPEILQQSEYPIRARKAGVDGEARISQHLLLRASMEAVSVKWIVQVGLEAFERNDLQGYS